MSDLNDYQIIKVGDLPVADTLEGLNILGFDSTNNRAVRALMTLLKGLDGKPVELQKTATHLQWRVEGGTWTNLLALDEVKGDKGDPNTLSIGTVQGGASAGASITGTAPNQTLNLTLPKGDTGSNIELQKTTTHVQWRVVDGTWANLIPLADLKGEQGDNISLQKTATHIQWRLGTGAWTNLVALTELKGDTGANIELQKSATHVQWRVQGTSTWNNLIPIDDLKVKGDTGANIELQKSTTHVQWRVQGTTTWTNLIPLSELKGEKGDAPVKGVDYFDGTDGKNAVMTIGTITTVASNAQADATVVADGVDVGGKPKFKLNLWLPKGVDGEGAGDMLKSVYDSDGDGIVDNAEKVNGFTVGTDVPANAKFTDTVYTHPAGTNPHGTTKADVGLGDVDNTSDANKPISDAVQTALNGKVGNSRVLTDVPVNAKFTDTTYSEITEAEINTGTASTLRSITARRVTFILSKVSTLISNAISALTKNDVGLGNLDNIQQATKVEFNAHNVDAVKHITASERTAWNNKGSSNLTLGETTSTAYRGDRGKIAYDHSQLAHAPSNAQKNSDITKAEIEAKLTGAITSHTHSYLSDSPQDGKIYGRKDSSWTEISSGSGADVYDWSWLQRIHPPSGTCTQQQYDELLAAAIAGKIFSMGASVSVVPWENDEIAVLVSLIQFYPPSLLVANWTVLPDLNVFVNHTEISNNQVVAELPASPMPGVFYFIKE